MANIEQFERDDVGTSGTIGADEAAEALFQLGIMYSLGHTVARDLVTAHKWFNLAALRGYESAREYRREIASEMTAEEVAAAQRMAREWLMTVH